MFFDSYDLIPRYSCGSPAMVHDSHLVDRVIRQEKESYLAHLEGFYGPEGEAKARREGLSGIVLGNNNGTYTDLITEEVYRDIPYRSIRTPEQLVVVAKAKKEIFFFRRKMLCSLPFNKHYTDSNMMGVFTTLFKQFGFDPYGKECRELWQKQISA